MESFIYMQDLSDSERMLFQAEYSQQKKSTAAALLLTFFLGGFGGHRFYMGDVGLGILYLLFFWTFIPGCIAFIELFLISGRVDSYNSNLCMMTAAKIKSLRGRNAPTAA
jgi:TM2 domain-containing membrane protein YozV